MLKMAGNLLPTNCLHAIYFSHIYSHMQYCLGAWGSMISKSKQDEIFDQQKQCVHIMGNKKANSPVDCPFKQLNIVKFPDMIKIKVCKFGYKTPNKLVPKPLQDIMESKGGLKQHGYNTGYKRRLSIRRHTGFQYNRSFLC